MAKIDDMQTQAQLLDETAPTIEVLKTNIRKARKIAVHLGRPTCRYDHALRALGEIEAEMSWLAQFTADDMEEIAGVEEIEQ